MMSDTMSTVIARATRRRRALATGAFLAFVGILLAASFQFVDDHGWYWTAAPIVSLVVVFAAAFGGFLVGHGLRRGHNPRLWLIAAGGLLGVAWLGTSGLASVLAALGMSSYLPGDPIGWESYTGAVWFSGSHIRFLQSAAGTGLIGGVAIGMGLALKRLPALELLDA